MRLLLALCALLLVGCDDRGEVTAWRGHPSIVLCSDQPSMFRHAAGRIWGDPRGFQTLHGIYDFDTDTVYLLCSDPNQRLSIPQALYLAHELQHRADERNDGSLWALLQDESAPNGYSMGGPDFDCHHHPGLRHFP